MAVAVYLLALATIRLLILGPAAHPVDLERSQSMWFLVLVPLMTALLYFLTMFTFGLEGDVAARQSIYPARLFTLPVTTAGLAGWPMLYGAVAVSSLWPATALFALRPSGIGVPLIWPALFGAAFLAWTQALLWMPYGLRGLRVIIAVLWLAAADTVVMLAIHYKVAEFPMVVVMVLQLPVAYLAARYAVARARRGDVPDWLGVLARRGQVADLPAPRRSHFASPARAQLWFEWRQHGRSLPALVGILLPFELALLFISGATQALVFYTLVGVLLTPPFMAAFAAATVGKSNPHVRDSYGLTPFMATRPLTSAVLIAAKLKAMIWSTLAAWLLVLVAIPLALTLSGRWPVVIERAGDLIDAVGTPRVAVFLLLLFFGLMASTWKQLVQTLYIGMAGREWVVKLNMALALVFLCLAGPIAQWIHDSSGARAALWDALPWIAAILVGVKMSVAAWITPHLYHSRLLSDRTLVAAAACWLVVVLAIYGALAWLVSGPLIPHHFLLLIAILEVPLVRLSAAPLALAWNRHR